LANRSKKRKRIVRIHRYRVAPEIQPCVSFIKYIVLSYKPFRNGSGDTNEAIAGCCIDSAGITGSAAVIQLIIYDTLCQQLGFDVQLKAEIPEI
jgi:hypothetical protein